MRIKHANVGDAVNSKLIHHFFCIYLTWYHKTTNKLELGLGNSTSIDNNFILFSYKMRFLCLFRLPVESCGAPTLCGGNGWQGVISVQQQWGG